MKTSAKASSRPRPLWASPAGKSRTANYLAALLPQHKTYVEPFAGGAAVFFAKSKAQTEIISDRDPEIAAAFRCAANLGPEQQKELASTLEVYEKSANEIFEGQSGSLRALDVGPADAERDKQ